MPSPPCVSIVTRRSKRILPRERHDAVTFTSADKAKLDSIPFGGLAGGGLDIDEENTPVSANETTVNFTGHVNVTDEGSQTTIDIPEDIDGGVF